MFKSTSVLKCLGRRHGAMRGAVETNLFVNSSRCCSDSSGQGKGEERSRENLFIDLKVQNILKSMTGYDVGKIFSQRPVKHFKPPKYLFLTDEELKMTQERAKAEGAKTLEMPPIMDPWKEEEMILEENPEWKGFDRCNLVITDISPGFSDRTRLIAVRQPDGTLRRANWEERYRMNQIYFPKPGKSLETPKMFEEENLKAVLDRHDYKFVLDRACIQFEPDDPKYIDITSKVYEHINESKMFDLLRSTRHFGNLAFSLAFEKKIDLLLIDMIDRELLHDAVKLIQLFYILNPPPESQQLDFEKLEPIPTIKQYLKTDCKKRHLVETSLKNYLTSLNTKTNQGIGNRDDVLAASHG